MKCRNIVNGKECGVDLSPNANCCVECGEDVRTIECPKCSTTVKETQKFCLNCKWKVEENAFVNKTSPSNVTHEEVPADESVGGLQHVPLDNEGKCKTFCLIYQKHSIFFFLHLNFIMNIYLFTLILEGKTNSFRLSSLFFTKHGMYNHRENVNGIIMLFGLR